MLDFSKKGSENLHLRVHALTAMFSVFALSFGPISALVISLIVTLFLARM